MTMLFVLLFFGAVGSLSTFAVARRRRLRVYYILLRDDYVEKFACFASREDAEFFLAFARMHQEIYLEYHDAYLVHLFEVMHRMPSYPKAEVIRQLDGEKVKKMAVRLARRSRFIEVAFGSEKDTIKFSWRERNCHGIIRGAA